MGKPLLTDEMIERTNRGEKLTGPRLYDDEETKIIETNRPFGYASHNGHGFSQETLDIKVEPTVVKSRRIENAKRGLFESKLNKILLWIVLLLAALLVAIFKL
ncbi:cell wall synthase accessory phosphoprotein MacP [Streptococcus pneumoniae]